ncbi:MAG: radical SAM protein [Planctomycetes bacterium]|nr:radical SAM protein [Planctomycetota bacterium]MBI3832899.1 radical SAM protein [Planctomycetota bacterium]
MDSDQHDVRLLLNEQMQLRQVNKILHGFPSPRLWRKMVAPVSDIVESNHAAHNEDREFHLYVGVPYCIPTNPGKCGYCLFPVEDFAGSRQIDDYLGYLEREGQIYRPLLEGRVPQSVYIGGGTPNLLKADQYGRLVAIIRTVFPNVTDSDCITLEGIPPLFSREKLLAMKDVGIRRISMGVQQLNSELNAFSGRKQTVEHTLDAIEWCQEFGLACNADLIFGWPRQTVSLMLADLERLVATGVDHITHYELNVGGATDFALHRRDELPSPAVCREMYHASRDFLAANGYRQRTPYDFEKTCDDKAGEFVYEECERDWHCHETFGWGFAGVSNFQSSDASTSLTYVNARRVKDYVGRLSRDEMPIECGFRRDAVDHRLDQLFRHLQGMWVDRRGYQSRFGADVLEEHRASWDALRERGLVDWSEDRISLTPEGVYYTPLVQTVLAFQRNALLRERAYRDLAPGNASRPGLVVLDSSSAGVA